MEPCYEYYVVSQQTSWNYIDTSNIAVIKLLIIDVLCYGTKNGYNGIIYNKINIK